MLPSWVTFLPLPCAHDRVDQPRAGAPSGRVLLLTSSAVVLLVAVAVVGVLLAPAASGLRPVATSVINCTARAEQVAADVRAAVEGSVGATPTSSSVETCEAGHSVSVGLDFAVLRHEDISAALTRNGCRSAANPDSEEFTCQWRQETYNIDIVLIRRGVTSVVASVDL